MVDAVVQLAIVVALILSVNLSALIWKFEHLLFIGEQFWVINHWSLLRDCAVEWSQDYRLCSVVFEHLRVVDGLEVVLREAVSRLLVIIPDVLSLYVVVGVFFLYKVLFFLCEYLQWLVHILQPGVFVHLLYCDALLRIDFKKSPKQVDGFIRDFFFKNELSLKDLFVKILHWGTFEWYSPIQHGEQNDSCAPKVDI